MNRALLLADYTPAWLGARLECHEVLPSTNDRAREILDQLGPGAHGSVILADGQSAGRGRFGRTWVSPPGASLAASVALWCASPSEALPLLPLAGSVAVARALKETASLCALLKWPNDVVCAGRKIAGVNLEGRWNGPDLEGLVLGIGVNLRQGPGDFPPELGGSATSLFIESGRDTRSELFAAELLKSLEPLLEVGLGDPTALLAAAAPLWVHQPGDALTAASEGVTFRGTFIEVAGDGALVLEEGGRRVAVRYGEARDIRRMA